MKTRAKKPTAASKPAPTSTESKHVLPPSSPKPPHLFILPRNAGPEARILSLPHPVTSKSTRFLVDPGRGLYEFTRVSAARKKECRSVLLAAAEDEDDGEGYVLKEAELFVATALDAVFALLPAFWGGEEWGTFYDRLFSSEDHEEDGEGAGRYAHLRSVFQASDAGKALEKKMETAMRAVCDVIEMGDEVSYKLSTSKLAHVLFTKAQRMVSKGLPPSLSEHFIRLPLQAPELSVKREDSTLSIVDEEPPTTTTTATPAAEPEELKHLLRLRTALAYLCSNYIPASLVPQLQSHFNALVDFAPLDVRLAEIARLKAEAVALRSIGDNISRKRRGDLDDDDANARAETKKRLKMEEDMKKKNVSLGVKKLAKVDVKGMKKMSSFFTKKS
ncbi:hypothetical protein LTR56_002745 [Elasticomyces elasticus]|nr:hypothetical protein LTR56_002745 [Elasticomyces elasticus]KAK3666798.1 hypothetical protein LTR22_002385 [Elasticomyces elasticus]KAK4918822.1 hypothetical protein LTR49_013453 [Elasticomyces elasticus]KAK5758739.1 hypothetical protein LTS12_011133 [Elasticomyces elasticus]